MALSAVQHLLSLQWLGSIKTHDRLSLFNTQAGPKFSDTSHPLPQYQLWLCKWSSGTTSPIALWLSSNALPALSLQMEQRRRLEQRAARGELPSSARRAVKSGAPTKLSQALMAANVPQVWAWWSVCSAWVLCRLRLPRVCEGYGLKQPKLTDETVMMQRLLEAVLWDVLTPDSCCREASGMLH